MKIARFKILKGCVVAVNLVFAAKAMGRDRMNNTNNIKASNNLQNQVIYTGRIQFQIPDAVSGKVTRNNQAFGFSWQEEALNVSQKSGKEKMEFVTTMEGKFTQSPVITGKLFLTDSTIVASGGVSASALTPDFVLKMKAAALTKKLKSLFKKYDEKSNRGFYLGPGAILAAPSGHEISNLEFKIREVSVSVITKSDEKHSPVEFANFNWTPPADIDPEISVPAPPAKIKRNAGPLSGLESDTKEFWTDSSHVKHTILKKTWVFKSPKLSPYEPDIYISVQGDEGLENEIDNVFSTLLKSLQFSPT